MRPSSEVLFATSNRAKYAEARDILSGSGIGLGHLECELSEIQSDSLREIALAKARDALALAARPVIVDDAGLFIESLGGFPGPYSAYVQKTIGNSGVLRALGALGRGAVFAAVVAYAAPGGELRAFESEVSGTVAGAPRGAGWGYDPIFVPGGRALTYAEMPDKNAVSHRAGALAKFASWLNGTPRSRG